MGSKGADALSLKEAAQRAKVSRAVAYQHFKDRDHLLREAKRWISQGLLTLVVDIAPGTVRERSLGAAKLILDNIEASKLLVNDAMAGETLNARHPIYQLLLRNLKIFRASGRGRSDLDVSVLSFILLGAVPALIMLAQEAGPRRRATLAKRFADEWEQLLHHGIFATDALSEEYRSRRATSAPAAKRKARGAIGSRRRPR